MRIRLNTNREQFHHVNIMFFPTSGPEKSGSNSYYDMRRKQSPRWEISLKPYGVALFCLLLCGNALADDIAIGVLAYEGRLQTQQRWQPTADYLSERLAPHRFRIQALTHKEFEHAINKGKLDFILTNPGHYALLQTRYGASRIATFIADHQGTPLTRFSSVIFTRKDSDINTPEDLRGYRLAAVSEDAFGGYQLARHTLLEQGVDTQSDPDDLAGLPAF